jgi:uncharacterized membrane protein (UPF0182 family)
MYSVILLALLAIVVILFINGLKARNKVKMFWGIIIGLLSLGFFWSMGFLGEELWFGALGYDNRFWLEIIYSSTFGIVGAFVAFGGLYLLTIYLPQSAKYVKWTSVLIGTFSGGMWGYSNWDIIMRFWDKVPTTLYDPIFGKSVGYYLFTLPLLDAFYTLFFTISFLGIAASFIATFVRLNPQGVAFYSPPYGSESTKKLHASLFLNFSMFLLVLTYGKFLDKYHLMYSSSGVVYGPGWSDVNILVPAYNIIIVIMLFVSILIIIPYLRKRYLNLFTRFRFAYTNPVGFILVSIAGSMILLWFVGLTVVPGIFEALVVKPNEITFERPYITNNIKFTQHGFGLNKVEEKEFPESGNFTMNTVKNNPAIFNNIRLWDWRALDATYRQFQGFRLYYQFSDVDVDRYIIDGDYRQVMVSAREMDINNLPQQSQTFVNRRFQYTHGYGVTMSTVNEFTSQGLPHLLIKNIPIESEDSTLDVTQPRIYYGELTNTPVIVNSKEKEFDFPNGNENVYNRYSGKGGVLISNLWRKFLFGWKYDGTSLLFSDYPTDSSRIMFHRQIQERVNLLAPFLKFDNDPYIVLSEGNLYWMIDAYTTSDYYPYCEPFSSTEAIDTEGGNKGRDLTSSVNRNFNGANYIRNSVKVVVNAFNGSVDFYIFDKEDPIINVWSKIYPGLFKPESEMPKGLLAHIRYPEDMLLTQGLMYEKYHMTDPTVFYNQEDIWVRATEKYYSSIQPVEPYYIIWQLPDSETPQFSLILPFTPKNRQVLIGWIAGMCDPDNYGKLITYQFPKGKMITGPQQVETKIDQDSYLSGQLTLWDQRGSNVIRGNVLAIPVANTLFYVEPIYLQAETAAYPELRLVVIMHGDDMSYAETFDQALNKFFNIPTSNNNVSPEQKISTSQNDDSYKSLIKQANEAFNNYLNYSGQKKFSEAAKELEKLQESLNKLSNDTTKNKH